MRRLLPLPDVEAPVGLDVEWANGPSQGNGFPEAPQAHTPHPNPPTANSNTTAFYPAARVRSSDIAIRATGTDACIGPGNTLNVEVKLTNSGDGPQNDNPGSEFIALLPTQLAGVIGSCSVPNGTCSVGVSQVNWNGAINPGQTVTITYRVRVRESVEPGARFCTNFRVNFDTNNDGQNDQWVIRGIDDYPDCRVEVYNRWGNPVFVSQGYRQPWDGKSGGQDLPPAIYQYVIKPGGSHPNRSGSLLITR